jgi:hypothetical protein
MAWRSVGSVVAAVLLTACQSNGWQQILGARQSAVELRSYQTRAFDTTDRLKTLRTVIATLQDLGFVIDEADATLGAVTATKLNGYQLRMTVTVRERDSAQLLVRANAQYEAMAVETPGPYQQLFEALQKAMFLTAQQVD